MKWSLLILKDNEWKSLAISKSRNMLIDLAFVVNNYKCKIVEVR